MIFAAYSANAYVLQGGKLNGGVSSEYYYIGMSNSNLVTACTRGVNAWNYVMSNSSQSFSFTRSTNKNNCSIRFWAENQPSESWYGLTRYYTLSGTTATRVTNAQNRDYASCILNTYYYDSSLTFPTLDHWIEIAAHEMGHGMGLAHTSNLGTLMYPHFDASTAVGPTGDEVSGICAKY